MTAQRLLSGLLLGLLAVWCVLCLSVFLDEGFRHFVDSSLYILTAKSLAAGEGYVYHGSPFFLRPPALSWVLSFFGPERLGAEALDVLAIHRVIQWSAVLAFAAVAVAMRRLQGPLMGAAVALLVAVSPLSTGAFNKVFSGLPFLALLFAGAACVMPGRDGKQVGWVRGLAGALCLAASLWMRSIGVLILPGLVLGDVFRKEGRRWQGAVLSGVVVALWLPWVLWAGEVAEQAPRPSTQLALFDYQTAMFHVDKRDPASAAVDMDGWIARVMENAAGLAETVDVLVIGTPAGPVPGLPTALVAAALLFTWWRRRSLLDWYAVAYVALMLLYFTFVDRLLLGMLPMIYSALLYSVDALVRRASPADAHPRTPAVAVAAVVTLLLAVGLVRAPDTMSFDMVGSHNWEHVDDVAAEWLRANTEPEASVLYLKAPVLAALSGREVYTYRNLPGTWPQGCPSTDWAIFTPNTSAKDRHERAVREAAGAPLRVPFKWLVPEAAGGYRMVSNDLRVYDLRQP